MLRRVIVVLSLVLVLLVFVLNGVATASSDGDYYIDVAHSVVIPYSSYTGFVYNDDMLFVNANALSTDLAKASVVLSMAAYNNNGLNVREILSEQMKYPIVGGEYTYTFPRSISDNDRIAYTIGVKEVNGYSIYCIPIRGTAGNAEWLSNFNLGENNSGEHQGFNIAANRVLDDLYFYSATDGKNATKRIIWLMGHSRGAAVANIVAGKLTEAGFATSNHIFGYTFACPSVSKNVKAFDNIYNFNNAGDLIPSLPLEEWGYGRYGHTISMNLRPMKNVTRLFKNVKNHTFSSASQSDGYTLALKALVPIENSYHLPVQRLVFLYVGYILDVVNGGGDVSLLDVIGESGIELADGVISIFTQSGRNIGKLANGLMGFGDAHSDVSDFINGNQRNVADMTPDDFTAFYNANRATIRQLENLTGTIVNNAADFSKSADKYWEAVSSSMSIGQALQKVIGLYLDENGSSLNMIQDGHAMDTYVIWINSMFCGYKGWYESSAETVNLRQYTGYGARVTSVGPYCFYKCSSMDGTIIPNIGYVGKYAFYECESLTASLTGQVSIIDELAFYNCAKLSEVSIDGAISIGNCAFYGCGGLSSVSLGEQLQTIGDSAFGYCDSLTELEIPNSVVTLGAQCLPGTLEKLTTPFVGSSRDANETWDAVIWYLFSRSSQYSNNYLRYYTDDDVHRRFYFSCPNLEEVSITDAIAISNSTFRDLIGLKHVYLNEGIITLNNQAFYGCTALEGISIPKTVTSIGSSAFFNCSSLAGMLEIPAGINEIPNNTFYNCSSLTTIRLPNGLTEIGESAFSYCDGITALEIPNSVIKLGARCLPGTLKSLTIPFVGSSREANETTDAIIRYLFGPSAESPGTTGAYYTDDHIDGYNLCPNLEEVNITDATLIPNSAFKNLEGLKYIQLNEGIKKLYNNAFSGCKALEKINIPSTVTGIGSFVFYNCSRMTGTLRIPSGVTSIGNSVFYNCSGLSGTLIIPSGVTSIGSSAFYNCSGLSGTLKIPSGVTSIGSSAFYECSGLTGTLEIPAGVTEIPNYAFNKCCGLSAIRLPNGLTEIGESAFGSCDGITELVIPNSVVTLGSQSLPGTLERLTTPFVGSSRNADETWDAVIWYLFSPSSQYPNKYNRCFKNDYYNCWRSYYCCPYLKEVSITNATAIPNCAFRDLDSIKYIHLNEGIKTINNYAFYGCTGLEGMALPSTVTSIGIAAFYNCNTMTEKLVIPVRCVSLSDFAFSGCLFSELSFTGDAPAIGSNCFQGIAALARYPSGNETWTEDCFQNYGGTLTWIPVGLQISFDRQAYDLYLGDLGFGSILHIVQQADATNLPIEWVCSDEGVVSVAGGRITGLREGKTTVTARLGDVAIASCEVTVHDLSAAMKLPSNLKIIEEEAFANLPFVQAFALPEGVERICARAFAGCSALCIINIPASVECIDARAFDGCDGLTIYGISGSAAEQFAIDNAISFEVMGE